MKMAAVISDSKPKKLSRPLLKKPLPKLKRNPLSGARTRYSMSSDEAWYRTQRYAARVLLLSGAALLIITLLPVASPNASLISTAAALVIPVILIAAYRPK